LINGEGGDLQSVKLHRAMAAWSNRAASVIVAEDIEEVGEVQFPFYSDIVYQPKNFANFGVHNQDFARIVVGTQYSVENVDFQLWRAAGDDFDCSFLMGVPRLQCVDTNVLAPI